MTATLTATVVLHPEDVDQIEATCHPYQDGHIAAVRIAEQITLQCGGDGTANLLAVLDDMKAKAEAAHTVWLREMAAAVSS